MEAEPHLNLGTTTPALVARCVVLFSLVHVVLVLCLLLAVRLPSCVLSHRADGHVVEHLC